MKKPKDPPIGFLNSRSMVAELYPDSPDSIGTTVTLEITNYAVAIRAEQAEGYVEPWSLLKCEDNILAYMYDDEVDGRKSAFKKAANTLRELIVVFGEWAEYLDNYKEVPPHNKLRAHAATVVSKHKKMLAKVQALDEAKAERERLAGVHYTPDVVSTEDVTDE